MSLHLWEGYGVELEYMIVDGETLQARPIADELIRCFTGDYASDCERGAAVWSNELVLHVIEFKTNGPAPALEPLARLFQEQVREANRVLASWGARLLPTGMHPFFDPLAETRIWPHEYNAIYETYNRIFDCRSHGWSNLQSTHVNLPFADDDEFGRLHAAIRYLLPIMPGLAASSPIAEGKCQPALDFRMVQYACNSARIPSATGKVVPEACSTRAEYYRDILEPLWADTAPFDPEGNLRGEYANARGAMARFDRGSIEIRVLDVQEHPEADLAIIAAVTAAVRALVESRWRPLEEVAAAELDDLVAIFRSVCVDAENAVIRDSEYLRGLGVDRASATVSEVWQALVDATLPRTGVEAGRWRAVLDYIRTRGTLAARIRTATGPDPSRGRILAVYRELARCLEEGRLFEPDAV